jgi:hypothetical protein
MGRIDLQDPNLLGLQKPCQSGPVGTGGFNTHAIDRTHRSQPVQQLLIANQARREFLIGQTDAVAVECDHMMRIFMCVNAPDDLGLRNGCNYAHINVVSFANNEG